MPSLVAVWLSPLENALCSLHQIHNPLFGVRRPFDIALCGLQAGLTGKLLDIAQRTELYCEGDDDVMAEQGDRDRPNPRQCLSFKLAGLTGRRSSDSIRARGDDYAASRGRIDDCKPSPLLRIKTTCNQRGVKDDTALSDTLAVLSPDAASPLRNEKSEERGEPGE
jgi:hypothetical protein